MLDNPSKSLANPSDFFYFDAPSLISKGQQTAKAYANAEPFPHAILDNFISEEAVLDKVLEEFPKRDASYWNTSNDSPAERGKMTQAKEHLFGPSTRHLLSQFNSATFLRFLENLTGIKGLIPDPYYLGGGLHEIQRGGFLKVHTDFSWYPELKLRRRINVLLYLNRDWKKEYGGHVEFWDKQMSRCVTKALPIFNRCVIFSTTRFSYHGHPDPLTCPENRSRRSLAFYYYTAAEAGDAERYGTLFLERPGEKWFYPRNLIARCMPPILYDAAIKLDKIIRRSSRI